MKLKILSAALIVVAAMLLPMSEAEAQKISSSRVLTVNVAAKGQAIVVKAGDLLRFNVTSSPSTGYRWSALEVEPDYLTLVDKVRAENNITYIYYVKKSLNLGTYSITVPIVFTQLAPGRNEATQGDLIQFNLVDKP